MEPVLPPAPEAPARPRPQTGRSCDGCNVCCVVLTIDDPDLKKDNNVRCPNAMPDNRCGIYLTRPQTCRDYECGWLVLPWVSPDLKPDRSGVLVSVKASADGRGTDVVIMVHRARGIRAEGLAETVAAGVNAGVAVFLSAPGGRGWSAARVQVNDAMAPFVAARDKPGMQIELERAYRSLVRFPRERLPADLYSRGSPA